MSYESAVLQRLMADETATGLAGTHPVDRQPSMDWTARREGAPLPGYVFQEISDARPTTHDGFDSIRPSRVQLKCLAKDKMVTIAMREAAIAALVTPGEFFGVWFDRAHVENAGDCGGNTETGFVHGSRIDFIFWHKA